MLTLIALLLAQEPPTGRITSVEARPAQATVRFETDLPAAAALAVEARLVRHVFDPRKDTLVSGALGEAVQVRVEAKAKSARLDLLTPGLYEFRVRFAREIGNNGKLKRCAPAEFGPARAAAGEPDRLLQTVFDDGLAARRRIDACLALFDRLEKDGIDPQLTLKLLNDIKKEQDAATKETSQSLLNATNEFIAGILADLEHARQNIKDLIAQQARAAASGGGGGSSEAPEPPKDMHGQDGETYITSATTGRPLSLAVLRHLIKRADALRVRETLSWSAQFAALEAGRLDEAAVAGKPVSAAVTVRVLDAGLRALQDDPKKERQEIFTAWDADSLRLPAELKKLGAALEARKDARDSRRALTVAVEQVLRKVAGREE